VNVAEPIVRLEVRSDWPSIGPYVTHGYPDVATAMRIAEYRRACGHKRVRVVARVQLVDADGRACGGRS